MADEGGGFTPEQIAKDEQVTEYYRNLPLDSRPSPPEPIFKDLIHQPLNWVDPDIVAYYEETGEMPTFDRERETEFHQFFQCEWQDAKYDDLRKKWEYVIEDEDPKIRVLAKTALWSVVRLRKSRESGETKPIYA